MTIEINELFERTNLLPRISKLSHLDQLRVAVFSAEKVPHLCESKVARLAIEYARNYIADPSEENKEKCRIAVNDAFSANAALAANIDTYAAALAANIAAYATVANATAVDELKREILDYLVKLEMNNMNALTAAISVLKLNTAKFAQQNPEVFFNIAQLSGSVNGAKNAFELIDYTAGIDVDDFIELCIERVHCCDHKMQNEIEIAIAIIEAVSDFESGKWA